VVGGRVSDLLGARRAFVVSLLGFAVASLACGLAPGLGLLIGARLLQGLSAALLSPAALTLLTAVQGRDGRRDSAVAVWTAVGAGGGASGWLVGGLLAERADWRWVFLVNLPIGVVTLLLVRRHLPQPPRRPPGGLDLPGAVAATVGLALLVGGLTQAASWRTAPLHLVVPLAGGAAVLVWFRRHERRASEPLLPTTLLADPPTRGANLVALLSTAATTSAMVLAVFFLQDVLRLPAGRAAWYFPAFNLTVVIGSLLGPRVLQRAHPRRTAAGGLVLVASGASVPPLLDGHVPVVVWLSLALALMGFGLGVAAVSSTAVGLARGEVEDRGLASGVLTSAAQVGNAIGFAFVVPFSASPSPSGHLGPMAWGFLTSAVLALVGALASRLLPGDADDRDVTASAGDRVREGSAGARRQGRT
jgi:MFS family permease